MCYVLTDNNFFLGKDFRERPIAVTSKDKAYIFKTGVAADNFLRNIPNAVKDFNWIKCDLDERDDEYMMPEVKKGNPKNIKGWSDLGREDITVLNRRVGSSARILMDIQLKRLGISASKVKGYDKIMKSHLTMAAAVAAGEADLAIGTERISHQIEELDFIPLLEERFDLVIKKEMFETDAVKKLMKTLQSPVFRQEIARFSGNDYRDLGKLITEV